MRRLVIVTGLSGAGKSQAMKSFEDLGFACLDNLPPVLAGQYVALADRAGVEDAAIALDVHTAGPFGNVISAIDELARDGYPCELLFLDADDATLVRRYSETRRRHPFAEHTTHVLEAIAAERRTLAPLRDRAEHVWNTAQFTHAELKMRIEGTFAGGVKHMRIGIVAFGYKYGVPPDVDLAFDVRFLANPYYVPALRPLTGDDPAVQAYIDALPDTAPFLERLFALLDFVIPRYQREGKSQLTIGIGCTGGRHRSVYLARRLAAHFEATNPETPVAVDLRDCGK
jgi:UPF0042 nucleotide-binding protein